MNRTGQRETDLQLANALQELMEKKPFQKITVNELCQKSGLHRSTFYLHFNDKYDLLSFYLENLFEEFENSRDMQEPLEFLTSFLGYCQEKEKIFSHILTSGLDMEFQTILHDFLRNYFIQCLHEKNAGKALLPGPLESVADFYVGGLMNSIIQWMRNGYKIPKERLAACQYRILKNILK